jgi:Ca2+-binding RTX toxin-like protein
VGAGAFGADLNLASLNGTNGFRLSGAALGHRAGISVSGAGDVNGDGFADLLVGAFGADPSGTASGAAYVVFGCPGGFAADLNLGTLDGSTGFRLSGEGSLDFAGISVSGAGDVNGNGFDDLLVGAYRADPNGADSGGAYAVLGGDFRGEVSFPGTAGNDRFTGTAAAEILIGGPGDDRLAGEAGADVLGGAAGNDTLTGGSGADRLAGGAGADAFVFNSLAGADTVSDFVSGTDRLRLAQAGVRIGDGDTLVEGAVSVAGPGGFAPGAELVIVTGTIAGAINTASAAAAIGGASAAYAAGATRLFAVDNGASSGLFLFISAGANAGVSAAELTLLATLQGTAATAVGDYLFVA